MAKRGRPPKYQSLEEVREAQKNASKKYYDKNAVLIRYKAKLKRQEAKENKEMEAENNGNE